MQHCFHFIISAWKHKETRNSILRLSSSTAAELLNFARLLTGFVSPNLKRAIGSRGAIKTAC